MWGTLNFQLSYIKRNDIKFSGFTDADWVGSSVDRKSTTEYCLVIVSRMTSWCSKRNKFLALGCVEVEYMAEVKVIAYIKYKTYYKFKE